MKLIADLLPVLLFFIVFKLGGAYPDVAAHAATQWFGAAVSGGVVTAAQAPILWATLVAILASIAQVVWQWVRHGRVERMLWISLAIIVVFGGATIWFHDETFIKWKPTVLYWAFALALLIGRLVFGRNLIRGMMQSQIQLPDAIWGRLNVAWMMFFGVMGVLNLFVAYRFPTETWVSFKLFGFLGLTLLFVLAQGLLLSRHMREAQGLADEHR
ncbi:MAG TPA: septation protein A [Burkholderiaceae bacterium]|nr:septation protein A [Burkholderiaceae bacterium]